jgi:predicted PurR-regulated permease PerM
LVVAPVVPGTAPAAAVAAPAQPPAEVATITPDEFDRAVPRGLQIAASWSWRVLAVGAMLFYVSRVAAHLSEVVIPVAIAILLTALLAPVARRMRGWGVPGGLATAITVLGGLAVIAGGLTLIVNSIVDQASELSTNVVAGFNNLVDYLERSPLPIRSDFFQPDQLVDRLQTFLVDSQSTIATYAAEIGTRVGHFFAGLAIALFSLIFFLHDGRGIFTFLLRFFPRHARDRVDQASVRGWHALSHYVRATVIVALVDGIGVLAAALILGVPVAPALAALVFLGAFIPIIGAFVSGFVAVLVALVAVGWVQALIMLGAIIVVMQIEGHILQPFILGRAVKLHPLAVVLAIAIGLVVAGIVGALLVVPLLAFTKTFVEYLNGTHQPQLARALRWPAGQRRD